MEQEQQMQKEKQYVTRLKYAECSLGSMKNRLNLPLDHGVVYSSTEYPLMNANDHVPDQHIVHFGRCTSSKNVGNIATKALETATAKIPLLGSLVKGSLQIKKMIGSEGCKCKPKTVTPWVNTNKKHLLDGAPALMLESEVVCYYGGKIQILEDEPPEEEPVENEDEMEVPKHILEYLPESMQDKIGDFCGMPSVDASPAAEAAMAAEATAFSNGLGGSTGGNAFGSAGIPGLNFNQGISQMNMTYNQSQIVFPEALDTSGNIVDAGSLYNFNVGMTNLATVNPGCVETYNLINQAGGTPDLSEIIFHAEQYALRNTLPLGGTAISMMSTMEDFLSRQGIKTDIAITVASGAASDNYGESEAMPFVNKTADSYLIQYANEITLPEDVLQMSLTLQKSEER